MRARTPSSETPLRLGLVGAGAVARTYLAALEGMPQFVLAAAAETDPARRAEATARMGVPVFAAAAEMVESACPDAALVCTPPASHAQTARLLLDAGCHVLCEKPLAVRSGEAEGMLRAARSAGRLLMMASKFRYVEDVTSARRLLEAGAIGDVLLFENVFCSRVDMTHRWNSVREVSGGGVLIDNGSHSFDVARFLVGPVVRVLARFGRRIQPVEVEDTARVLFESEGGAIGSIDLSWSLHKETDCYVRLHGALGTLEIGWRGSRWRRQGDPAWTAFGGGYRKTAAFRSQLRNFARAAQGLEEPRIPAEDGLWSVRVVEAAYLSAAEDRWVEVSP